MTQAIAQRRAPTTRLRTHSERLRDTQIKGMADDLLLQLAELQLKVEAFVTEHSALRRSYSLSRTPRASVARGVMSSAGRLRTRARTRPAAPFRRMSAGVANSRKKWSTAADSGRPAAACRVFPS